jgi:hypothetical protein
MNTQRTIQINYDLRTPGRNYEPLYAYIKSHGVWAHPLQSMWLIRTRKTASQIRDELKTKVDSNDHVLTLDVTGDAWASNFDDSHIQWLYGHMAAVA